MRCAIGLLGLLLTLAAVAESAEPAKPIYEQRQPSRDGIGKFYMGREISHVMGHRGSGWLERDNREREERTDLLIERLPVEDGD
ncbi:MAG: SAM-dependent methyltransferase, partial [Gammaproteobacteria bacterium]|nr:SAM-dependent methyltransferase [Gammaproteobacteria bacterium]